MKFMDFTLRHSLVWLQAVACSAFTFLLGGGPIEMFCAFLGAGAGNFSRAKMNQHHLTYSYALRQALLWHVLYTQLPSWH